MKFKSTVAVAALLIGGFVSGTASATAVSCGNSTLGVRITVVDPALLGGFCYAQTGNFNGDDFSAVEPGGLGTGGLTFLNKQTSSGNFGSTPFSITTSPFGGTSGTWVIGAPSPWDSFQRVFIGFHFGGGGDTTLSNPDSFVLELARADLTGTWALTGTNARLNGLSNLYLLGYKPCTGRECGGGGDEVPEPATLALVAIGLVGAGVVSRRRQVKKS